MEAVKGIGEVSREEEIFGERDEGKKRGTEKGK